MMDSYNCMLECHISSARGYPSTGSGRARGKNVVFRAHPACPTKPWRSRELVEGLSARKKLILGKKSNSCYSG